MTGRGRGRGAVLPAWMKNQGGDAAPGSAPQPAAHPNPTAIREEVGSKRGWDDPDRPAAPPAAKRPAPAPIDPELPPGWEEGFDAVQWKRVYWFNRATGERTWVKPKRTDAGTIPTKKEEAPQWESAVDPGSGRTYYYNLATQERVWDLPAGAVVKKDSAEAGGGGAARAAEEAEEGEVASRHVDGKTQQQQRSSEGAAANPAPAAAAAAVDELPPGWRSAVDANGRTYFYNNELNISQWHRPTAGGGAAAALAPAKSVAASSQGQRPRAREAPLDPMDPAAYSDAPRGGWGAGLGREDRD